MSFDLRPGLILKNSLPLLKGSGVTEDIKVVALLAAGTQGAVHKVETSHGKSAALKWYKPEYLAIDRRLRGRLEELTNRTPPSDSFVWPLQIVSMPSVPEFGYLMKLIEPRFVKLGLYLSTPDVSMNFRCLSRAGYELATAFHLLHMQGLCYHDIHYGNVFVDPTNGDICICDNDNIDVNGVPGAIAGLATFKAPEIVRGEARPTTQTDLHSLAVLLFFMLMLHDPLEGRAFADWQPINSPDAIMHLYGTRPLFIWHPDDESNRPLPGMDDPAIAWWPIYPKFLRDLFVRAFTIGLDDPLNGRLTESVWRPAMLRLRDSVFFCSHCGKDNYFDETLKSQACWFCQVSLPRPPRLDGGACIVTLSAGAKILPYHVNPRRPYDLTPVLGTVERKGGTNDRLGIRNTSKVTWSATLTDGSKLQVSPDRHLSIDVCSEIDFGPGVGRIVT